MNNFDFQVFVTFFWKELLIGTIYKKDEKYIYYPDYSNIIAAKAIGMPSLPQIMEPQLNFGELPSFFKERIGQDPQFKLRCRVATDEFRLIPA